MAALKKAQPFQKALYFSEAEFKERQQRALQLMERENLGASNHFDISPRISLLINLFLNYGLCRPLPVSLACSPDDGKIKLTDSVFSGRFAILPRL